MGWQLDLMDGRDYHPDHVAVRELLLKLTPQRRSRKLPRTIDLREYFPAAADQGSLNASTAFAVAALVGYFEARSSGQVPDASPLFLYQVALKLIGLNGNSGVNFRTALKAMVRCGMPPASHWPYESSRFGIEPADPFLFSYTRDYGPIRYIRLDTPNREDTL